MNNEFKICRQQVNGMRHFCEEDNAFHSSETISNVTKELYGNLIPELGDIKILVAGEK
jgi:hypothetical protein